MVKIPDSIKKILKKYVENLSKEVNVDSAILFGSYALGNQKADSDIDLAIFSENFTDMDRTEAIAYLLDKALEYDIDLQPLAFEKKELENYRKNPFINEIVNNGIRII
ncbi:MAG: nucleotidyltransferase domain-containing protein [Deltaproteobacteria bacterium]|nr:nucleotidyltransferase domain-containing protein [Deltaproteobacteria bacterium]